LRLKDLQKSDCQTKIFFMADTDVSRTLRTLAQELLAIAERLAPQVDVAIPKKAAEKAAKKECLQCDKPALSGRRGLCQKHYSKTMRHLRAGDIGEATVIAEGMILPESQGGRKPSGSPIDDLIAARGRVLGTAYFNDILNPQEPGQNPGQKKERVKRKRKS
jgi:hypothetical protein